MRTAWILLFVLAFPSIRAFGADAEPPAAEVLADTLVANRHPLALKDGALRGVGADLLLRRAGEAQFVLIGEDHGFAETPRIAMALNRALGTHAFPHLVIETGRYSTELLAKENAERLAAFVRAHPGVFPFFIWQDDVAMAKQWTADDNVADPLWGIDQEFILATQVHLQRLVALAPDVRARKVAQDYLTRAQAADARMLAQHDPANMFLPALSPADFARLREGATAEAAALIAALEESAEIYRLQNTNPFLSNRMRSELMKREFMAHYRAAERAGEAAPRAMFRMGAFHMYRGLGPTRQFDIGNLASELAASNGRQSLHVLVLAAGGKVNRKLPFLADESLRAASYDAASETEVLGAKPLLDAALPDQWVLIDLVPLRASGKARTAAGQAFEELVFGYDLVLIIPQATAALDY